MRYVDLLLFVVVILDCDVHLRSISVHLVQFVNSLVLVDHVCAAGVCLAAEALDELDGPE